MAEEFFRPRPAQRRGGFRLVVDTLYRDAADEVSSSFTFDRDVLEAFVRRIYEKDFHPMTDIELQMFRAVWDTLDIATDKGFGKRPADDPDHDFYEELKRNNAVFAAFKVHRMQNDMAALLLDSNGVLKPFERWAKEVMPIADHRGLPVAGDRIRYGDNPSAPGRRLATVRAREGRAAQPEMDTVHLPASGSRPPPVLGNDTAH